MEKVSSVAFSPSLPERGRPRRQPPRGQTGAQDDDLDPHEEHGDPRDEIVIGPGEYLRVELDPVRGVPRYLGVSAATGQILRRYEPDEALRLIGRVRQIAGLTLDTNL
jgi:hypothetical protein